MQLSIPTGLTSPLALAAALLVIPVILLYLLKPKPKIIRFPSIQFMQKLEETKKFSSFFNKFIRDPLLLIQILMIILLTLGIANPYAILEKPAAEDEAIAIIIDSSGSMQSTDVSPTRFDAAISKAKEIVKDTGRGSKISIILAENIPVTILNNRDVEKALEMLDRINCGDTTTNTGDALMLAKDLLSQSKMNKKAYLISDFSKTEGDLTASKRILNMNGISVHFIKLNAEGNNLGVIDMETKRNAMDKTMLYMTYTIKNYDETEHQITHKTYANNMLISMQTTTLKPNSDELFYVNTSITQERQVIKVELLGGGMLALDDTAYGVIPELKTYRTMLLTSENSDKFVTYAIDSQLNNRLRVVEPPVIPPFSEFDCIAIGSVKRTAILPGTFRDIESFVESGKTLIVIASPDLEGIDDPDFKELMPVELKTRINLEKNVKAVNHEILSDVSLENVVLKRYFNAVKKENATVIAEIEGVPIIAYWNYGEGKVAYVGVNPSNEWSNFHYSSSFPIFWSQLIEYINQKEGEIKTPNMRTGSYLVLEKETDVTNPDGSSEKAKSMFLDKQGIYTIDSGISQELVAANLIDEKESNIKTESKTEEITEDVKLGEKTSREDWFRVLLVLALILLLIEMKVYRRRGLL